MSDDFDFDSFGGFDELDSGIDDNEFDGVDSSFEDDSIGFNETSIDNSSDVTDKKAVIKTAVISIVAGVVLITGAFITMNVIQSKANKSINATISSEEVVSDKSNTNNTNVSKEMTSEVVNTSDWKLITTNSNIDFKDEYVDSIFTIVNIKNYVKVVDSESNLVIKTILSGNLSGFTGNYEIEIPYSKGSQLLTGNNFNVKVQLGEYNKKIVVGEIKY